MIGATPKACDDHDDDPLRRRFGSASEFESLVRTLKASAASAIGQDEKSVAALAGSTI